MVEATRHTLVRDGDATMGCGCALVLSGVPSSRTPGRAACTPRRPTEGDDLVTGVHQQNPDGSWTPATPEPMHPGIDWEVGPTTATAYDGWTRLTTVRAPWPWLLRLRIYRAHRRLLRAGHQPLARTTPEEDR